MKASTELLLWHMLYIGQTLFRPSYMHAGEGFEGWAYRTGVLRQIQRLEAEKYLERLPGGRRDRIYRLTPKGRMAALGGKDPEEHWGRDWDGRWRLITFDLPMKPVGPRKRLRKVLAEYGLGCLQGSVWISPHSLEPLRKQLRWGDRHPASLLLFEGRTVGSEKPAEVVKEAWNFERIQEGWTKYTEVLGKGKKFLKINFLVSEEFREWTMEEQQACKEALAMDPLLPAELLPKGYSGRRTWKKRLRFWEKLHHHMKRR